MHFDALTLACVTHELKQKIEEGRVQQVLLPDEHSIGLEVYAQRQRFYLLLSAQPGAGRVHLSGAKLRRGVDRESPLLLLLRKYVRDSRLAAITQPDPAERILYLQFDHAQHGTTTVVAEPMGRLSNVLLLGPGGNILECIHRVRPGEHAQRVLLPGRPYQEPRGQEKLSPLDDGLKSSIDDHPARLEAVTQAGGKLWKSVVAHIAGASPTLAREVAWRATGDADADAQSATGPALAQTLQELWAPVRTGEWTPGVLGEDEAIIGFSAFTAHFRGRFVRCDSVSAAIEEFYAAERSRPVAVVDGYAAMRGQAAADLRRARRRVLRQLEAIAGDEPAPGEPERLRAEAEWLLALSSQVQSEQTFLEVDVSGDGSEVWQIELDGHKTPVEQAGAMFKRAAKLSRAAKVIPKRRKQLQSDLAFLDQLETDLALAQNQPEIAAVEEELRNGGFVPRPRRKSARPKAGRAATEILRYDSADGFEVLVGRNARQNEMVTFKLANASDRWLHVRDVPGAHVVIRNGGQPVSQETIRLAAQLAAYYSKAQGERAAEVSITERRFVSRLPGGRTGQVLVRSAETITVPAQLPEDARIV